MQKKYYLFLVLLLNASMAAQLHAQARVTVDWTNQFFVSKTSDGREVYVFMYPDRFVFVYGLPGRTYEKINITYPQMPSITEIFIAGDALCRKMNENIYVNDLSNILKQENNNKRLSECGDTKKVLYNISTLSVAGETIIYTKASKDGKVYQYTPKDNTEIAIPNINVASGQTAYLLLNPIKENLEREYESVKNSVQEKIRKYNSITGDRQISASIQVTQSSTIANLYSSLNNSLNPIKEYSFDQETFSRFFELAMALGKGNDVQPLINTFSTRTMPNQSVADTALANYKISDKKLTTLANEDTVAHRRQILTETYNKNINTEKEKLLVWGNDYKEKYATYNPIYDTFMENNSSWENIPSVSTAGAISPIYSRNKDTISRLDNILSKMSNQWHPNSQISDNDYIVKRELYDFMAMGYENKNTNYNKSSILNMLNTDGNNVIRKQRELITEEFDRVFITTERIKRKGFIAFRNDYVGLEPRLSTLKTNYDTAFAEVPTTHTKDVTNARTETSENLSKITGYLFSRYICDLFDKVSKLRAGTTPMPRDYNKDYMDYNIIESNGDIRIQGFKITGIPPISFGIFNDINPRFIQPHTLPYISAAGNAVYIISGKDTIKAFDFSHTNAIKTSTFTIPGEIAYLVKSGQYQYVVNRENALYRIDLEKNTIQPKNEKNLSPNATILITSDDQVFILEESVPISGANTWRIKSSNSVDIIPIGINNRQFIIGGTR